MSKQLTREHNRATTTATKRPHALGRLDVDSQEKAARGRQQAIENRARWDREEAFDAKYSITPLQLSIPPLSEEEFASLTQSVSITEMMNAYANTDAKRAIFYLTWLLKQYRALVEQIETAIAIRDEAQYEALAAEGHRVVAEARRVHERSGCALALGNLPISSYPNFCHYFAWPDPRPALIERLKEMDRQFKEALTRKRELQAEAKRMHMQSVALHKELACVRKTLDRLTRERCEMRENLAELDHLATAAAAAARTQPR